MRVLVFLLLALLSQWTVAGEAHTLRKVCLGDDERFCAYEANPEAPRAVVLVHGLNGSALNDWQDQLALLAQQYHVLAIELPGFDQYEGEAEHYSMGYFSEVVHRFASRYIHHPYILIGHSMGGAIALRHTLYHPEAVSRLVLVDVAGVLHRVVFSRELVGHWARHGAGEHSGLSGFLEKMTIKLLGTRSSSSAAMLENTTSPRLLASLQLVDQDFSGQLIGMWVPTLLVWGADDTIAPLRTAYSLNLRLPNSRLKIIPGAAHLPMREQSEIFNRTLLQFLHADRLSPDEDDGYRLPAGGEERGRVAVCRDRSDQVYEGDYARIEMRACERVQIRNARVRELVVNNSRVSILLSEIGDASVDSAITARGADIKVTASLLRGKNVLDLSGSRIDLAGTTLHAGKNSVVVQSGTEVLFSVSELRLPDGTREYLHGVYEFSHQTAGSFSRQQ